MRPIVHILCLLVILRTLEVLKHFCLKLFDWSLRLQGYDIAFAKAALKRIQSLPKENYLEKAKKDIVNHHKQHNSFYQKFAGIDTVWDWKDIPILTKADLQQPLQERLSKGYHLKNIHKGKTSGSSGHPFTYAKDKTCHALSWASFYDHYEWYDLDLNNSKQARFYGIPLDFLGYRKERLKDRLGNRYRFSIFDLNDHKMQKIVKKFKTTPFNYINGYTSSIVLFAKYLKRNNIILTEICPTLKACIVTSEMLFESDRELLEQQFNIPIINEYGASEIGLIAFQNQDNELKIDNDLLFVEILDDQNNILPDGEVGRIIITSLYNKAHPFIRYEIGDLGALSRNIKNNTSTLSKLQGRTNDIAILPSGKVVPGLTFYYITKSVIEESGNVSEFVIEQTQKDTFKFIYTAKRELTTLEKEAIKEATYTYLENGLTIFFKKVSVMDRSNRGKLKQFVSKVL